MTRGLAGNIAFRSFLKTDARCGRAPSDVKAPGQPCRTSYSCHLPD
jgi:hypothetical protein